MIRPMPSRALANQSTIPKPVADLRGLEGNITFKVSGRNVMVVPGRVPAAAGRGPPPVRTDRTRPAEAARPRLRRNGPGIALLRIALGRRKPPVPAPCRTGRGAHPCG